MRRAISEREYMEMVEAYKADPKRTVFFNQMIRVSEMATSTAIYDPAAEKMTFQLSEPDKSKVDQIKKELLRYDLTHYPDLLIETKWSADDDLYGFEFRKDDDTLIVSPTYIYGFDDLKQAQQKFINTILEQI